jgi:hypothetical protein
VTDLVIVPNSIKTLRGLLAFIDMQPPGTLIEWQGRVISLVALHSSFLAGPKAGDRALYHKIDALMAGGQAKTIEDAAGQLVDQGLVEGHADYDSLKRRLARNYRRDRKILPRE